MLTHRFFDRRIVVLDQIAIDGVQEWPGGSLALHVIQDLPKQDMIPIADGLSDAVLEIGVSSL